jgi:glycosyltransferase involved in cell wall biosynthesis
MTRHLEIPITDYTGIPDHIFRIGVVVPTHNCVVEKVLYEMQDYFRQLGAVFIMALEEQVRSIAEYFPRIVIYFRCGTQIGTNPNILAGVADHITYYQSLHIPVVYYLDDAFFHANNDAPTKILANTNACIFATEALVDYAKNILNYSNPIHLLKTHMNIPIFDMIPSSDKIISKDKFNILFTSEGRIGTVMLDKICERMSQTPEKYKNVRIICVTSQVAMLRAAINRWRGVDKVYFERVPLAEYYGLFKQSDICISPGDPEDLNYFLPAEKQELWLASKSCVKYTVAGAARIPCIASPNLKEYAMAIKHEETGYLATTVDEYLQYIDLLIANKDERERVGRNARLDVVSNWHIIDRSKQFLQILKGEAECL